MPDPWSVLGLGRDATVEQARSARRRLAKQLHPDVHAASSPTERAELARRMSEVNRALAEVEATSTGEGPAANGQRQAMSVHPPADLLDGDSFTVAALPVDAFEALFLAAYGLGDILVADEPYALELYLVEPAPCFCQLTIVPEAGGSIVTIDVAPPADEGVLPPPVEAVRDLLVAELNQLSGFGDQPKGRSSHQG
jgi:hypothetical protein